MNFIEEKVEEYSMLHTTKESELLNKIDRETHLEVLRPRMLSGHFQGRILSMLSKMISPNRILATNAGKGNSVGRRSTLPSTLVNSRFVTVFGLTALTAPCNDVFVIAS